MILSLVLGLGASTFWALGFAAMLGFYGPKRMEGQEGPQLLLASALWVATLPLILAYGFGCYVRIRITNWIDQN